MEPTTNTVTISDNTPMPLAAYLAIENNKKDEIIRTLKRKIITMENVIEHRNNTINNLERTIRENDRHIDQHHIDNANFHHLIRANNDTYRAISRLIVRANERHNETIRSMRLNRMNVQRLPTDDETEEETDYDETSSL